MKRLLLLLVALAPALLFAQSVAYTKFTLDNGMTFILHEDHTVPEVYVDTWFHVGSKDEPEHRSGFAHLFEHLMFMGTFRVPKSQFDTIMESAGGFNNAETEWDRTDYYDFGPASSLPTLLWLEADRLEHLGKAMTKEKVDLQRQVVLNERHETENSPYGNAGIKLPELMYPVGHPYHFDPIGLPEDLNAATVSDVKNFFATYYVPNNATMAIVGDFDSKKIRPLIDKLFGTLPRQNDPIHRSAPPIPDNGTTRVTYVDQVQFPRITMAWHSPAIFHQGDAELDLASAVLSNGISSRLYQKLIYQDKLATDVSASQTSYKLGSQFIIQITAAQGVPLDQLEKETREVLSDFAKNGPTQEELQRQIAQLEYSQVSRLQSLFQIAEAMQQYDYYLGNPDSFAADLDRYRGATTESVRAASERVIGHDPAVVMTVVPKQDEPKVNPRATRPKDFGVAQWTPPAPKKFQLSNGVNVVYWERPQLPLMSMTAVLSLGSEVDPQGKEGASDLTAAMLDQGAGGKSATEFSDALDSIGASFGAGAAVEDTTVSISSTEENFGKAVSLFTDAMLHPNFDAKEWDRIKKLHLEGIQEALDDPSTVAQRIGTLEYFGANHPYGRIGGGTLASVEKITLDDIKSMHEETYQPGGTTIFAAGSMHSDDLKSLLEKNLGGWKQTRVYIKSPKPTYVDPPRKPLRVYLVEKPQAVQTSIMFLMPAPHSSDPKRLKLEAIGTILGGTFTSRLNHNLREEKGYTYGVYGSYTLAPSAGVLTAFSAVRANVTGASLKEFLKEFASIRTGNITEAEAKTARETMRSARIDTALRIGSLLAQAVDMHVNGHEFVELGAELKAISAMKAADLNAIVKASVPEENSVLILVGDKAQILAQLKGLGLPTPVVVKAQ